MIYEPQILLDTLVSLAGRRNLAVAYSGGLDSSVLLHSLVQLRSAGQLAGELRAVHVNHGINPAAGEWQAFCEATCTRLDVPLESANLQVAPGPGESLEGAAREARYDWFSRSLKADECLLLAHHQDDQMETLLLSLLRGAGPGSLAMPLSRPLGRAFLIRPLLSVTRSALQDFAERADLAWVEDDSNAATDFDRNYLRHEILPLIESRWSGYRQSWQKSLSLSREAGNLMAAMAATDLAAAATEDRRVLQVSAIKAMDDSRRRNALRLWLAREKFPDPGWRGLLRISKELIGEEGSNPAVQLAHGTVQRFRDRLCLLGRQHRDQPVAPRAVWLPLEQAAFELDANGRLMAARPVDEEAHKAGDPLLRGDCTEISIRYRQGGEVCRLPGRPTKKLKSLLQEAGVAPWLRNRYPLLYSGDVLVCIPGIGVSEEFAARQEEGGLRIDWTPPELLYAPLAE